MRLVINSASLVILLAVVWAPPARSAARLEFIDVGTPRSGDLVMHGWRGFIVRGTIDGLPITEFDFGDDDPRAGFIAGNMAQRWTDPTGQGNYTVTSPGPSPANNSFDSDFNFDTHILGTPEMYVIRAAGEASLSGFFPSRTGLPSNGFVGYGATLPRTEDVPILMNQGGHLAGRFEVKPEFQQSTLDLAYIVADGPVVVLGNLHSGEEIFTVSGVIPEPGVMALAAIGCVAGIFRRPRRTTKSAQIQFERLEPRFQLSVPAPTGVAVTRTANGTALVAWNDVMGETGYVLEKSYDGSAGWYPVHAGMLPSGQTQFNDSRGSVGWYRVKAIDAEGFSASTAHEVSGAASGNVTELYLEAEGLMSGGIKLKWRAGVLGTKTIYRRPLGATGLATLLASNVGGTEWTDVSAPIDGAFEYIVQATAASGSIHAGNAKPAAHDRGTVLLVIDQTLVDGTGTSLQPSINQFSSDLIGEGYRVLTRTAPRKDVPREYPPGGSTAQEIIDLHAPWRNAVMQTKGIIRDVWNLPQINLTNVVLIGRVPVPYTGRQPADGHTPIYPPDHRGAWASDVFYSSLNAADSIWTSNDSDTMPNLDFPENYNYPGDGKFDADFFPSGATADVAVGRIDFAGMNLFTGSTAVSESATDAEVNALGAYFAKNHQYRTGQWNVKRQALIDGAFPLSLTNSPRTSECST